MYIIPGAIVQTNQYKISSVNKICNEISHNCLLYHENKTANSSTFNTAQYFNTAAAGKDISKTFYFLSVTRTYIS